MRLGTVVFAVGGSDYRFEDVVGAAEVWGDWADVRDRVRQGLACLEQARECDEGPADDEVVAAANEFRYERKLETAEATEEWLERWGLTVEDWTDYICWSLLRRKWADRLSSLVSARPIDDEAIESAVGTEAICSGDLARVARRLAARAAIHERELEAGEERRPAERQAPERGDDPDWAAAAGGAERVASARSPERLETLDRLERSFRRFRRRVLTQQSTEAWIRMRQVDWLRIDCLYASFPDEDVAREAALALRVDERGLHEVAVDARTTARRGRFFVAELEPAVRDRVWSARPGDIVGPIGVGGAFLLYVVIDKIEASTSDADVRRRAEQTLLQRSLDREVETRVRWHVAF